jgi:hypothetical protein
MYFADNHETNVNTSVVYDKILIEYAHNWPSSTGIAPAGELNQLVIYISSGADALTSAEYSGMNAVFAISGTNAEDQLYSAL